MKKSLFAILFACCLSAHAQQSDTVEVQFAPVEQPSVGVRFAYFRYQEVFESMPDYAVAKRNIESLRSKYDAEAKRVEEEFNRKYEEFLDGQKEFPPTILQKRQSELQELMYKNIQFKEESHRLLEQAEKDAFAPLHEKIAQVAGIIGRDRNYAFVLNTDNNSCPFVNPLMGDDITQLIKRTFEQQ